MATNEKPQPLSVVVGESLRRFREARGLRQEDIAEEARKYGFSWGRSSVASLESGNRDLSVNELLLLPSIIKKLGGWEEPLVPSDARLLINESLWMPASQIPSHVFALFAPSATPQKLEAGVEPVEDEDLLLGSTEEEDHDSVERRIATARRVVVYEYMFRRLWPQRSDMEFVRFLVGLEISRKVADRIVTPDGQRADSSLVHVFGLGLWGRTVGAERDARADARGSYETKRALQSARGHVTRELIEELQAEINRRWPEVTEILEELEKAVEAKGGFEAWEKKVSRVLHPDPLGYSPQSSGSKGVHRKRKFLRNR